MHVPDLLISNVRSDAEGRFADEVRGRLLAHNRKYSGVPVDILIRQHREDPMQDDDPMTGVRERIAEIQKELRDGALTPDLTRESLVTLTALLGNVNDECRDADIDFANVLQECYQQEAKANRARITAETKPQYRRKREAKDTQMLVIEMIRSCKTYLRSLDEEMRMSGNQR